MKNQSVKHQWLYKQDQSSFLKLILHFFTPLMLGFPFQTNLGGYPQATQNLIMFQQYFKNNTSEHKLTNPLIALTSLPGILQLHRGCKTKGALP